MSEQTISKEEMQSLKALSEVNLKVSEALTTLDDIKKQETKYFEKREVEAQEKIREVLLKSKELLDECNKNYLQIQEFSTEVSQFAGKLTTLHEWLQGLIKDFDEKNELWRKEIENQLNDIEEYKKQIKKDRQILENDKSNLEQVKIKLNRDQKKLESDRGTIERTVERLKNNRI